MNRKFYLLLLGLFCLPVQAEYNDPCVDSFLQKGLPIDSAFFIIGTCIEKKDGIDTTAVAKRHREIKPPTNNQDNEAQRLEIQRQVQRFFEAVYARQAQNIAAIGQFPEILKAQQLFDNLVKHTASNIFLEDGTLGKQGDSKVSYSASIAPEFDRPRWTTTGFLKGKYAVHFKDIVVGAEGQEGACNDLAVLKCRLALESMADWIRFQYAVTQNVHASYTNKTIFDFQQYLDDRKTRWRNFFEVANYPFLWESAINQSIESFNYEKGEYGLSEPPSKQLTVFRPSVAAGFQDGTGDTPHIELVIELIGFTRWKWVGTEAVDRWGMSLIATLAETSNERGNKENAGVGVLFHTSIPGVSFGYVDREEGEDGLIATFDFLSMFDDRQKQFENEKAEFLKNIGSRINNRISTLQ